MAHAVNSDNEPKNLQVDSNGNLKVAEQVLNPLLMSGKTLTHKVAESTGSSVTVHTVTSGKTFYLVWAQIEIVQGGSRERADLSVTAGGRLFTCVGNDAGGSNNSTDTTRELVPSTPVPFAAGHVFTLGYTGGAGTARIQMIGWEE